MANHMSEVAKMLGIELGEEFKIFDCRNNRLIDGIYCFTDTNIKESNTGHSVSLDVLYYLIMGTYIIKRKPWKPKQLETYWAINQYGNIADFTWINNLLCITNYKIGNCYRTREEAEANRDKWVKFYTSDEVLEV